MYDLGLSSIDNLKQDPSFWHKKTYENHIFINDVPFHSSHSVGALWQIQIQIQTNSHETEMSKSSGIWEVFIPTSRQSHAQLIKQFWKETEIYKWQARKLQAMLVSKLCRLTHSLTGVRCRATSVAKKFILFVEGARSDKFQVKHSTSKGMQQKSGEINYG